MTNKEKYAKEILNIVCNGDTVAIVHNKPCNCSSLDCHKCDLDSTVDYEHDCNDKLAEWCNKEYQEVDWSKIPVDTKVYVRNSENEQWKPRYFAKYDEYADSVMTYENGATSWSGLSDCLNIWSYVKLAED